ncbi:hypothetical protein LOK49_LG07G00446 [Camellia lanceoleosa]|uniref:Uncharacterized protein n=1 Tax=Camellia lanceoleosa TaxID=1840588 RepID=A0ACC0H2Z9_9ERIC|nr:hypothetical protein LOK49_LG07G00446 [Camellia lanceoleosa]
MAARNSAAAAELPPGWNVEVRVRKNGKKYKCYTDPSNGLKFFSKPEVFRYLNSLEINSSLKSTGKREGNHNCSAINSLAVAGGQQLADSGTNGQIITNQSSKLVEEVKDEKTLESSTGDCIPLSANTSDQRREGTSASGVNLPEATVVEQREEKSDSATTVLILAPVVGTFTEKLPGKGVGSHGNRKLQHGKKKTDLPRRASKRLAGIDVGPTPELKTNNQSRRVSARRLDAAEASSAVRVETNTKAGEESGSDLNLDLWTDPCIDFAIKTLMGAIPIGDEKNADVKSSLKLPTGDSLGDPCIEFAVKTLTSANPVVGDLDIQGKDCPWQTIR